MKSERRRADPFSSARSRSISMRQENNAAAKPVGVRSTMAEAMSACRENADFSARRRVVWKWNDAQSVRQFQTITGEKIASPRSVAAYGSQRSNHRRDGASSRIKTSVAAPTRPSEYFEIIPSPIHAPTAHQPLERFPINTRSSEYSAPAQQAVSGASGVISKDTEK